MQAHTPIQAPHGQSRSRAIEHGAGVEADDNHHEYTGKMSEVEQIEVLPPDLRQCGDRNSEHNNDSKQSGENKGCSPYAKRGSAPGPSLVREICRIEDG